jgi:general secretion pathway protein A
MYLKHYKLKEKPFQISTDPKFLWLGEKHKEGLATLEYGILENKGFLVLTGGVGTGKTTLINGLLNGLKNDVIAATVFDPSLDKIDFFNFVASGFGLKEEFTSKGRFLAHFSRFLHKAHDDNKKVLLILDEAHRINSELLEEIRLLSNIEKQSTKLINIFFVGQKELNTLLSQPENRSLKQRITIKYNIDSLTEEETGEYVRHRLKIAGVSRNIFSQSSIGGIYRFSGGIPRLINIVCDHALLTGYAQRTKKINLAIIEECAKELQIEPEKRTKNIPYPSKPEKERNRINPVGTEERIERNLNPKELHGKLIRYLLLFCLLILIFIFMAINKKTESFKPTVETGKEGMILRFPIEADDAQPSDEQMKSVK